MVLISPIKPRAKKKIDRMGDNAAGRVIKPRSSTQRTTVLTSQEALKVQRGQTYKDPKTGSIKRFKKQKKI